MKSSARINGIWISAPMPKISRCTIMLTSDGRLCQSQTARWYSSRSIRSLRSAARAISVGLQSGNLRKTQESKALSRILEAGTMLTIDQTEQRKSGDQRCSVRSDRIAVDDMVQSQIIDFESARQALERDRSVDRDAEQINRGVSNHLLTPSSDGLVESLVTIVLVVLLALYLLAGAIWGF